MNFDPDNLDIWREEEDLPRLALIGRALTAATVQLEILLGEPPLDGYRYVHFKAPEVCPERLFACVVGPEQDLTLAMERWVGHIFPDVRVPKFETSYPA